MLIISRKKFLETVALGATGIFGGWHSIGSYPLQSSQVRAPVKTKRAFLGQIPLRVDVSQWFSFLRAIGTNAYMFYAPHYRGREFAKETGGTSRWETKKNFKSVALISEMDSSFAPYINKKTVAYENHLIKRAYKAALANNIDFYYSFPFPEFPVQDVNIVRKLKPEFFTKEGQFNIYSPLLTNWLKKTVRTFKAKLPQLAGVNMWLAEGSGQIYGYPRKDLMQPQKWLKPIARAFSKVCQELDIEPIIFTHEYGHTGETLNRMYEVLAEFPDLTIMQDSTWPEENMLMPFEGYLSRKDVTSIKNNKILNMALIDTEYLGQGTWPGIYTRWWKYLVDELYKNDRDGAIGRVFFWDAGQTDINFNRINAHIFAKFLDNPEADQRALLSESIYEMFGNDCPEGLIDILYETEEIIKEIISINYVSPLSHSRFPPPKYVDKDYNGEHSMMKCVDDLFKPPGTPLYTEFTNLKNLRNVNYWRYQRKIVSKTTDEYLRSKQYSIDRLDKLYPKVDRLTRSLNPDHRKMFINGYHRLSILAQSMKIFVRVAKIHYEWYRAHQISKTQALNKMKPLAGQLEYLASQVGTHDPLQLKKRLIHFGKAIQTLPIKNIKNKS